MTKFPNRIREMRLDRKWTLEELSSRSGISISTVQRLEVGERRINSEHIAHLAEAFKIHPATIIDAAVKSPAAIVRSAGIAICGKVGAGAFIEVNDAFDPHHAEVTEAPKHHRFPNARHMAFEVQGDSMTLSGIMPGDFVIAVAWEDTGYFPLTGMIVVVEQTRNGGHMIERTIKEIEVRHDGVALLPRSSNHIHKPIFLPKDHDDDGRSARIVGLVYHVSRPMDLRF